MTWEEMTGYRSFEPSKSLAVCKAKAVPSFLIYFKTDSEYSAEYCSSPGNRTRDLPLYSQTPCLLSYSFRRQINNLIAIIPTRIFCEMQANFSRIEFLGTAPLKTSRWGLSCPLSAFCGVREISVLPSWFFKLLNTWKRQNLKDTKCKRKNFASAYFTKFSFLF